MVIARICCCYFLCKFIVFFSAAGPPSLMGGGGSGGGGGRGGFGSSYSRGSTSGESSSHFIKVKDEVKDEGETDEILKDIYRDDVSFYCYY